MQKGNEKFIVCSFLDQSLLKLPFGLSARFFLTAKAQRRKGYLHELLLVELSAINKFLMPNPYFEFKQFKLYHDRCAMKITTDSCLFGAWVAKEIVHSTNEKNELLDIGSGTGLLSFMVAQKNELEIDAVEIDEEAFIQSNENLAATSWKNRIYIFNKNILDWKEEKQYDFIISNPPFYENELGSGKQAKDLAHHSEALKMQEVISEIKKRLKENGQFFLLLPYKRAEEIIMMIEMAGLFLAKKITVKPSVLHTPNRIMINGLKNKSANFSEEEISIYDAGKKYTKPFTELLKDYYLHL